MDFVVKIAAPTVELEVVFPEDEVAGLVDVA
jgi:hypothetical protein